MLQPAVRPAWRGEGENHAPPETDTLGTALGRDHSSGRWTVAALAPRVSVQVTLSAIVLLIDATVAALASDLPCPG